MQTNSERGKGAGTPFRPENKKIVLANAGYREKAFVKARLAQLGKADHFEYAFYHYLYDPVRDVGITTEGFHWGRIWSGSESLSVLRQFGLNADNC